MNDVLVSSPIKRDPSIPSVWRQYCDATFVITICILMLVTLMIYVAYRYLRTKVGVGVRTIVFHNVSHVPYNMETCCICLCNFVDGDQLASLQPCKHVYHRRCIACQLAQAPTYPIVEASFQLETIECDIQMMGRGY